MAKCLYLVNFYRFTWHENIYSSVFQNNAIVHIHNNIDTVISRKKTYLLSNLKCIFENIFNKNNNETKLKHSAQLPTWLVTLRKLLFTFCASHVLKDLKLVTFRVWLKIFLKSFAISRKDKSFNLIEYRTKFERKLDFVMLYTSWI